MRLPWRFQDHREGSSRGFWGGEMNIRLAFLRLAVVLIIVGPTAYTFHHRLYEIAATGER